jgi:hypothetical protein
MEIIIITIRAETTKSIILLYVWTEIISLVHDRVPIFFDRHINYELVDHVHDIVEKNVIGSV